MFGKFKRNKSEEPILVDGAEDTEASDTHSEHSDMPAKKKFSSTDLVFGGGLVLIVGGMFWVLGGGLGDETAPAQTSTVSKQDNTTAPQSKTIEPSSLAQERKKPSAESVEIISSANTEHKTEPAPYAYENQLDFASDGLQPPPDSYEQNNTAIAKTTAQQAPQQAPIQKTPIEKPIETPTPEPKKSKTNLPTPQQNEPTLASVPAQNPEMLANEHQTAPIQNKERAIKEAPIQNAPIQKTPSDEASAKYVCKIVQAYQNMVGKEIMYYTKQRPTQSYLPAYSQKNWDESGIVVQKRLMALEVDIKERMVEVSRGKWIPALEFMTCTLVEESIR